MLYVFHHSKEKEKNGGKKQADCGKESKLEKGTLQRVIPPISLPPLDLPLSPSVDPCHRGPQSDKSHGGNRLSGSSVSGTKEQRQLDKGGPPNSTCEPIQATYV